jgi:hypothetical protein
MPLSDRGLLAGLFLLLMIISAIAAVQQMQAEALPALSAASNDPNGARALRLWLEERGYPVSDQVGVVFAPPEEASLILMLEPVTAVTDAEWLLLDEWVEAGGTLILAGGQFSAFSAFSHYDLSLAFQEEAVVEPVLPLFDSPPPTTAVRTNLYLRGSRAEFAPLLAANGRPVAVVWQQGEGRVIVTTMTSLFSNAGLKREGMAELTLNLISAGEPGLIWFNEWHHGRRAAEADLIGPIDWLQYTPTGQSLLYVGLVLFLFLLLRGRRFGRPTPLPSAVARRTPLEYIAAIANLNRRAGHRTAVLAHYHQRLKRDLGWRYHLDPNLPDDDYVKQLARYKPDLDTAALADLLRRLRRPQVSERELVMLVGETVEWLAK